MSLQRLVIGCASAALLLSCTTASLEELRGISPQGTAFQAALAHEYLLFSDLEAKEYDWPDSQYFAEKGLKAAYGQDVLPEHPADWDIPDEMHPEFTAARDKLVAALTETHKTDEAEAAARAQASYDCWLEQQEEGWEVDEIQSCKSRFYAAMELLEAPAPAVEDAAIGTSDVTSPKPLIRSTAYMLFFDHNRASITKEGQDILAKVVSDFLQYDDTEVLLHGHTDTSGGADYNMSLSEQRAVAVAKALIRGGISTDRINYFAFGETDLRVPTADAIREPGNRRVEIFLE